MEDLKKMLEMQETQKKEEKKKKGFWKGFAAGLIVAVLVVSLVGGTRFFLKDSESSSSESKKLLDEDTKDKLSEIEKLLDKYYLYDVDEDAMEEGLYAGVLSGLDDPYTVYYSKEEADEYKESMSGTFQGIGVTIVSDKDTGTVKINRVYEDSPAEAAGLKAGDYFVKVAGKSCKDMDVTAVASAVRGDAGTTVDITVSRDGEELDFTIERQYIDAQTVDSYMLDDAIGYIYVMEFDTNTYDAFDAAYKNLQEQGMKGLIIDLRENPGGDVNVCTKMLDDLLPEELFVYTEDKNGTVQNYEGTGDDQIDIPLVLLVNGDSASASEIFTGALQDYGVATVIGTTTYGKGVVQVLLNLDDGSMIKVTTANYYTPKGRNLNGEGITPDIEVELDGSLGYVLGDKPVSDNDAQLQKAIEVLKKAK